MKFLVFGAGALGSAIGGLLAQAGHDVALLGRAGHLEAIRRAGLRLDGFWGEHRIANLRLFTSAQEIAEADWHVILLTVKTYDTADAIAACQNLVGRETTLLSVQNGYGNVEALCAAFGPERVLGARVITGAEVEPGHVTITGSADALRIGPLRGEPAVMPRAEQIARALCEAGVPAEPTTQFQEYLWSKLIYNCALNPIGALLRLTYGELMRHPPTRRAMSDIFRECFAVCQAHGIPLFWKTPEEYEPYFDEKLVPPTASHYPSMLRDLDRRGRTEIDSMNGAVVRLGEQHGIATPVNRVLTALVRLREQEHR